MADTVSTNHTEPNSVDPSLIEFCRSLGRTEDLAYSPSGRRLALVAFRHESIGLVEFAHGDDEPVHAVELTTPLMRHPHGVDFLDDDTLVVANRHGSVDFFRIQVGAGGAPVALIHLDAGSAFAGISSPGSVEVARRHADGSEILVCDNRGNDVTAHRVEVAGDRVEVSSTRIVEDRHIDMPDGVASHGSTVGVSNHYHHLVLLYDRAGLDAGDQSPRAILRGCWYPHGLCFTPDGANLLVADAGSPNVFLYERGSDEWRGTYYPTRLVRVTTDEKVESVPGAEEGGPKGIAIDPSGTVAAVTSETVPLDLIDVQRLVDGTIGETFDSEVQFNYESLVLESMANRQNALETARTAARNRPLSKLSRGPAWIRYQRKLRAAEKRRAERGDGAIRPALGGPETPQNRPADT